MQRWVQAGEAVTLTHGEIVSSLRAHLATQAAALEKAERECRSWRALAEWESSPQLGRSVTWEPMRPNTSDSPWIQSMDERDQTESGHGSTVQDAAIDLATKLGLLDSGRCVTAPPASPQPKRQ